MAIITTMRTTGHQLQLHPGIPLNGPLAVPRLPNGHLVLVHEEGLLLLVSGRLRPVARGKLGLLLHPLLRDGARLALRGAVAVAAAVHGAQARRQ